MKKKTWLSLSLLTVMTMAFSAVGAGAAHFGAANEPQTGDGMPGARVLPSGSLQESECGSYDIYAFDTTTGETQQITFLDDSWEFNPRWSPNGKLIVHDVWAQDFSYHAVHVTDVADGVSTPLNGGELGSYPAWSPNGRWIAFQKGNDETGYAIFVVPAGGGSPTFVVSNASMASWGNNSTRLAIEKPSDDGPSIWTTNLDGTDQVLVVEHGGAPAWSPNGNWIAYDLDGDIYKMRVDANGGPVGTPIQLTSAPAFETRTSWSNSSKTIVYFADYGYGSTDIWAISADGGTPTRLTGAAGANDYDPNFSNNGRYVAYSACMPTEQIELRHPRIVASVVGDWMWTTDFVPNAELDVSVLESQSAGEPFWNETAQADEGGFVNLSIEGLEPGQFMTVSDGFVQKELVLEDITMEVFDPENETMAGTAPAHSDVWVAAGPEEYQMGIWVKAGQDGMWFADFTSIGFDITEDMRPWSYAQIFDEDWDINEADPPYPPPAMGLRVNYGHNWVESFYEEGHEVHIRVTDSDGEEKGAAVAFTEPKDYWGGESGFTTEDSGWIGEAPDLEPGDWVFAEVDNGVTAQVRIGDIQGMVDINSDSVEGTVDAPWIDGAVFVECLDWGSELPEPAPNKDGGEILPNGSDEYGCSWDPDAEWDVQPWQDIGIGYTTPEGHWVANAIHGEYWVAMWTHDPGSGILPEGDFSYTFDWSYSVPQSHVEITGPITVTPSSEAQLYDGTLLLRASAGAPLFAWTGSSCEAVSELNPGQPVLFVFGWVNDYSMSEEEAWAHFSSFEVNVSWDGPAAGSAVLPMGDLLPWYGMDTSYDYRCSLTGH